MGLKASLIHRNIDEIREDPVLRVYGACLAATHVLTFFYWKFSFSLEKVLATSSEVICWPFWEDCHVFRQGALAYADWNVWLLVYLAAAVTCAFLFLLRRGCGVAWWGFLALNLFKLAIVVQDFQLRLNQHYMAGIACMAFLMIPGKRRFLRLLIVFFYFWAGLLKLNREWLSGAALYKPVWFFTGGMLPVACVYVVVLEILLVWGLFSKRRSFFWATLVQLLIFHVFSWPVVGFFYPTLMFCLLALYPLDRLITSREQIPFSGPASLFLGIFSLAQMVPWLMPGDSALTGEGRFFGVHMFDALAQCEGYAVLKKADGTSRKVNLYRTMAARIHCDPIVYFHRAKALCRSPEHGTVFTDLDLFLNVGLKTDSQLKPLIHFEDFCRKNPSYRWWRHNGWILTGR